MLRRARRHRRPQGRAEDQSEATARAGPLRPDLQCARLVCWHPQWQGRDALASICTGEGILRSDVRFTPQGGPRLIALESPLRITGTFSRSEPANLRALMNQSIIY